MRERKPLNTILGSDIILGTHIRSHRVCHQRRDNEMTLQTLLNFLMTRSLLNHAEAALRRSEMEAKVRRTYIIFGGRKPLA